MTRRLVVVALVVAAWCALGVPVRATFGTQVTADEPEYLMTALSLAEDRSLDVSDERLERRYAPFHELTLPIQTLEREDGSRVSPHDPLLPVILAAPMKLGGWVAAKLTIAALAGLLAALTLWTAVRRFGVNERVATVVVLAFSLAPPLAIYGTQVYPELPAALVVVIAIACLTAPTLRAGPTAGVVVCLLALPWLAVKYVPVAAVIGVWLVVGLWRAGRRRELTAALTVLALGGVTYLAAHHAWYGGWTVYASGDHFVGGEFTVVGNSPNPPGRSVRLIGLLVDRNFGLGVWQPLYFLLPVVGVVLVRKRPPAWGLLLALFAAGWLNATFVALTMHGYWSPGRQLVVILPAVVLATAWWAQRVPLPAVAAAGAVGAVNFVWLVAERRTWVIDFFETTNPLVRVPMLVLPDYQRTIGLDWALHVVWIAAVVLVVLRTARIRLT